MRIQIVSTLLLLGGIAQAFPVAIPTPVRTEQSGAVGLPKPEPPATQFSTNSVQRVVLEPMQVIRIPVATDRLTTVRFPSPLTDLVSALVATEPHPAAHFLLSFQPGESFFSIRALNPKASTTLNVVWKSQTYVFSLVESQTPWLSVIMIAPEPTKPVRHAAPLLANTAGPWSRYLDAARSYEVSSGAFRRNFTDAEVITVDSHRSFGTYDLRATRLFRFRTDEIFVLQVAITNRSNSPLRFGPDAIRVTVGDRPVPILRTDFEGTVPAHSQVVTYTVVYREPPAGQKTNQQTAPFLVTLDPTNLREMSAVKSPKPRSQQAVGDHPDEPSSSIRSDFYSGRRRASPVLRPVPTNDN